eukprot:GHUV01011115.1.p1 GENE.GHUV01011115.1~~GHUV01011115.1.p1  ORF type:complete len:252 (+),score=77.55 GHUV01011115.1:261-1016(+)
MINSTRLALLDWTESCGTTAPVQTAEKVAACSRVSMHQLHKQQLKLSQQSKNTVAVRAAPAPGTPRSECAAASQQQSRRCLLQLLGLGVAGVATAAVLPAPVHAAAAVSSSKALEEYMNMEDAGKLKDIRSLDNIRSKYNMKRTIDGRVQLKRKNGTWMSVRLDLEVPGAILLRDTKTNGVYALETDQLPQVDLSDDYVLFMMFADGQWEDEMTPIEFDEDGKSQQLVMTEKEFHEFVGILKEPDEEPSRK